MRVFKGKSDRWGIGIFYCKHDLSITFDFACFYIAFVFYKYWDN